LIDMSESKPELLLQGLSLAVIGSFNPAIFHPAWLLHNELIRDEEADDAKTQFLSRELTAVELPWCEFQVTSDRFDLQSSDPSKQQPLRDLALGIFTVLEHTPVSMYGFNSYRHLKMPSDEAWFTLSRALAPIDLWERLLNVPQLGALIINGDRAGSSADRVQIRVEKSMKVPSGIFIHVNQHYGAQAPPEGTSRLPEFLKSLEDDWSDFFVYCSTVNNELFSAQKSAPE
jgi:hypothetical protein